MATDNGDSSAHTPGPWHAYFAVHGDPYVLTDPERPYFSEVAKVSTSPEDYGRANTLLIAAAPQMLDALQTIQRIAAAGEDGGEGRASSWLNVESIARHAIREATQDSGSRAVGS